MHSYTATRAWGGLLLAGCLFSLSVGCGGPNYKARAKVKGKVTIGGKALTTGSVMFYGKDNLTGTGHIDKDGNYVMNDAPIGDVKVTVTVPAMTGMGGPGSGPATTMTGPGGKASKDMKSVDPSGSGRSISIMGEMPSHVVPIPEKYSKPDTSGLTYKVEKGEHTHNIDLKP